jgi:hypothetical protein
MWLRSSIIVSNFVTTNPNWSLFLYEFLFSFPVLIILVPHWTYSHQSINGLIDVDLNPYTQHFKRSDIIIVLLIWAIILFQVTSLYVSDPYVYANLLIELSHQEMMLSSSPISDVHFNMTILAYIMLYYFFGFMSPDLHVLILLIMVWLTSAYHQKYNTLSSTFKDPGSRCFIIIITILKAWITRDSGLIPICSIMIFVFQTGKSLDGVIHLIMVILLTIVKCLNIIVNNLDPYYLTAAILNACVFIVLDHLLKNDNHEYNGRLCRLTGIYSPPNKGYIFFLGIKMHQNRIFMWDRRFSSEICFWVELCLLLGYDSYDDKLLTCVNNIQIT